MRRVNLLPHDGEVFLIQDDCVEFDWPSITRALIETIPWHVEVARIFGRELPLPRKTAWFGDVTYAYSGILHAPAPLPVTVERLRRRAETLSGARFNSVLLNLYRDGHDSVGWHSDNEPGLGNCPTIASLSLGGERRFQLRHRKTKHTISIELSTGQWLIMAGETQHFWVHQVPKTAFAVPPRVNLTFRHMMPLR